MRTRLFYLKQLIGCIKYICKNHSIEDLRKTHLFLANLIVQK